MPMMSLNKVGVLAEKLPPYPSPPQILPARPALARFPRCSCPRQMRLSCLWCPRRRRGWPRWAASWGSRRRRGCPWRSRGKAKTMMAWKRSRKNGGDGGERKSACRLKWREAYIVVHLVAVHCLLTSNHKFRHRRKRNPCFIPTKGCPPPDGPPCSVCPANKVKKYK